MYPLCAAALSLVLVAGTSPPRLFVVENWHKTEGGGPLPTLDWYSWRLTEVDIETGTLKGLTSWKGGLRPNVGDSTGMVVGASYDPQSEARNKLRVRVSNSGSLNCYDVGTQKSCSDIASPMSEYLEENNGFFTYVSFDDVEPFNQVFSLYDARYLDSPTHFATINVTNTTGALWMTQNWGVNSVQHVIYVAAEPNNLPARLYRIQRISGEVQMLDFPPIKKAGMGMSALFVDPAASGEKLLVLLSAEGTNHSSTLYELDVPTGRADVFLELPGLYIGAAQSHCKAFDKATGTLFLGCDPVTAVNLAQRKVVGTTHVQKSKPTKWTGGSYSIGGIVALPGAPTQSFEFV